MPKPAKHDGRDRHSGTGRRGSPKKGGAGGKGTWGTEDIQSGPAVLDKGDPNYDPHEEEQGQVQQQ